MSSTSLNLELTSTLPSGQRAVHGVVKWMISGSLLFMLMLVPFQNYANSQQTTTLWPDTENTSISVPKVDQEASRLTEELTSPANVGSSLKLLLMLSVLSVAPAVLLMTTSFIRISIVLNLLKQALGLQQLPMTQVIGAVSLFLTFLIMAPTWQTVYHNAVVPYSDGQISMEQAWETGKQPLIAFMGGQIDRAENTDDVWMFIDYIKQSQPSSYDPVIPESPTYNDVPMQALLPAYVLSELKTAFLIGFNVFLPFLILDIVVASTTTSMGMMMLPPTMVSLPFKLLLFVLVDGWKLIVEMLLSSFAVV